MDDRPSSVAVAFKKLAAALSELAKAAGHAGRTGARSRRWTLSPKARNALQPQGRYMGLVRHLPATQKARMKKIKETMGVEAAIAAAKK